MSTDPTSTKSSLDPAPDAAEAPTAAAPTPGTAAHGRRFRHRELDLSDGGRLILRVDGSISQVDASGAETHAWDTADPDWASHAIRFGLFPQDATVAPTGRFIDDRRPPRR
jgi:hypothetical protein